MTQLAEKLVWIAADWGSSHLRLWMMAGNGDVLHRVSADCHLDDLAPDQFEPTLIDLVAGFLPQGRVTPVIACGMAGSKQGWAEAPCAATPSEPPSAASAIRVDTKDQRLDVYILPGMKQNSPADLMRGQETQIAGFLAANPKFDGVLCLSGPHTRWAHISAGEVVSFRTFMTGELLALLASQSLLCHTTVSSAWDADAFATAVEDAMSNPAILASKLFSIHAEASLFDQSNAISRAKLSGLLIGAELAAARPYWLGQEVVIIGENDLLTAYQTALEPLGMPVKTASAETMTLAGLSAAYIALGREEQ